jgi:hypothetical protein
MDIAEMRRRLGHDDGLIADLLQLFLDDNPGQLRAISAAIRDGQLDRSTASDAKRTRSKAARATSPRTAWSMRLSRSKRRPSAGMPPDSISCLPG